MKPREWPTEYLNFLIVMSSDGPGKLGLELRPVLRFSTICCNTCTAKALRKLTITVEDSVYRGLYHVVGRRNISRFLNDLARPHVVSDRLEEGYRAMAADEKREQEATEWSEALVGEVVDEPR